MATGTIPITHQLAADQRRATAQARALQEGANHAAAILSTQDEGRDPDYVIYVYNILNREYTVQQPPLFPNFRIPECPPGEEFSYTVLPAFVNERYEKPGTTEFYYKRVDGRKAATSLLNPDTFPGTQWEAQLNERPSGNGDQYGNNLNAYGVFWSLTRPDDPKLKNEIKMFKRRVEKTMRELITLGNQLHAAGDLKSISPLMHFAMDYFNLQAPWHQTTAHLVPCPNCGAPVREGVAYHRNDFGDRCIIDPERYAASVIHEGPPKRPEVSASAGREQGEAPAPRKPSRKPQRPTA